MSAILLALKVFINHAIIIFVHSQHSKNCWEIASLTFIIPLWGQQEFDEISILYGGQMGTGRFEK